MGAQILVHVLMTIIIKYSIYCQLIMQSGPITLKLVRNLTQNSNKQ